MKSAIAILAASFAHMAAACPFPTMPHEAFLDDYQIAFTGLVTAVDFSPEEAFEDSEIKHALTGGIVVTDTGPAYKVRVVVTHVFKGAAPARDEWLMIDRGCHTDAPLLLESGIFAVGRDGKLIAGYEHPSEFFDYPAMLKALQRRFDGKR